MEQSAEIHEFPADRPSLTLQQPPYQRPDNGISILEAIAAILNARILALIALIGSVGVWIWAAYDPSPLRLYAGLGCSLGVLVPCLILAAKRG